MQCIEIERGVCNLAIVDFVGAGEVALEYQLATACDQSGTTVRLENTALPLTSFEPSLFESLPDFCAMIGPWGLDHGQDRRSNNCIEYLLACCRCRSDNACLLVVKDASTVSGDQERGDSGDKYAPALQFLKLVIGCLRSGRSV
jgi:hypothetical protein